MWNESLIFHLGRQPLNIEVICAVLGNLKECSFYRTVYQLLNLPNENIFFCFKCSPKYVEHICNIQGKPFRNRNVKDQFLTLDMMQLLNPLIHRTLTQICDFKLQVLEIVWAATLAGHLCYTFKPIVLKFRLVLSSRTLARVQFPVTNNSELTKCGLLHQCDPITINDIRM